MRYYRPLLYTSIIVACFISSCRDDFQPQISPSEYTRRDHTQLGLHLLDDLLDQDRMKLLDRSLLHDTTVIPFTQSLYNQLSNYVIHNSSVPTEESWEPQTGWQTYIYISEIPNVFILPSGDLFISSKMLTELSSEHELMYIMAFEIMVLENRYLINSLFELYNTNTIYEWSKGRYLFEGNSIEDLGYSLEHLVIEGTEVQTLDSLTTEFICKATVMDPQGIIPILNNLLGFREGWLQNRKSYPRRHQYISDELSKVVGSCGDFKTSGRYQRLVLDVLQ